MSNINFPNIGIIQTRDWSERPRPNVQRSEFEDGFTKQRKKFARDVMHTNISYIFSLEGSPSEYEQYKVFFFDTTENGSLYFNWSDPVIGTKEVRIIDGGFETATANSGMTHVKVTITLEGFIN